MADNDELYSLGMRYYLGDNGEKDFIKAFEAFSKASELGNKEAMFYIGLMYCRGEGIKRDYKKALEIFKKAAELGNAEALLFIGYMYYEGEGVEENDETALKFFQAAAMKGNAKAIYMIGVVIGNRIANMNVEALMKVVNEEISAMNCLSEESKQRFQKDAVEYYKRAADLDVAEAAMFLAYGHRVGMFVEKDLKKAFEFFQKALRLGINEASYYIGYMYYHGEGVTQSYESAIKYYHQAARFGNPEAMFNLGSMYLYGEGVEPNGSNALVWYEKADEAGVIKAVGFLGVMFYEGQGVEQNFEKALSYFERSLKLGDYSWQYMIGRMFARGEGVEQDYSVARKFLKEASKLNNFFTEDAKKLLNQLPGHFRLGGYMLEYHESLKDYMEIENEFNKFASDKLSILENAYFDLESIENVHNDMFERGCMLLESAAQLALKFCAKKDIYDKSVQDLLTANRTGDSAMKNWKMYFDLVENQYNRIIQSARSERAYREERKERRTRVIGGGFGFQGAAKGMLEAGAINMATGAIHGAFNMFGNAVTDNKETKNKEELYKDIRVLNTLKAGIVNAVIALKRELRYMLDICVFKKDDASKAEAIIENINNCIIPENKIADALTNVFLLNPFSEKAYTLYLKLCGDSDRELEDFSEFFGLKVFLENEKINVLEEKLKDALNAYFDEGLIKGLVGRGNLLKAISSATEAEIFSYSKELLKQSAFLGIDNMGRISSLGKLANSKCENDAMSQMNISEDVVEIEPYQFYNCKNLKNATIPQSVTKIGEYAFAKCTSLKSVELSEGLEEFGTGCFYKCVLEELILPRTLRKIGDYCFDGALKLSYLEIPEGVVEIGEGAFQGCGLLRELKLPRTLEQIGRNIFNDCSTSQRVICNVGTVAAEYCKENNICCSVFTSNDVNKKREYIDVPDGFTGIDNEAFADNKILKEVTIPDSIIEIGDEAFTWCGELEKVNLSKRLLRIGKKAFSYCRNLESVTIPEGTQFIGDNAFANCIRMKTIVVPGSVQTIDSEAFMGCMGLSTIKLPEGIIHIGDKAFFECGLDEIVLPDSLKEIGEDAFAENRNILVICNHGAYAYNYCKERNIQTKEPTVKECSVAFAEEIQKVDLDNNIENNVMEANIRRESVLPNNNVIEEIKTSKVIVAVKKQNDFPNEEIDVRSSKKNKVIAGLLAFFLGGFGAHKFYLGNIKWGVIYLLLVWTYIPTIIGMISGVRYFVMSEEKFKEKYLIK